MNTPEPAASPAVPKEPTSEGKALADAAIASAGHPLNSDDQAEVRTQLSTYPSSNGDMRRFFIDNGVAPTFAVTPPISRNKK